MIDSSSRAMLQCAHLIAALTKATDMAWPAGGPRFHDLMFPHFMEWDMTGEESELLLAAERDGDVPPLGDVMDGTLRDLLTTGLYLAQAIRANDAGDLEGAWSYTARASFWAGHCMTLLGIRQESDGAALLVQMKAAKAARQRANEAAKQSDAVTPWFRRAHQPGIGRAALVRRCKATLETEIATITRLLAETESPSQRDNYLRRIQDLKQMDKLVTEARARDFLRDNPDVA